MTCCLPSLQKKISNTHKRKKKLIFKQIQQKKIILQTNETKKNKFEKKNICVFLMMRKKNLQNFLLCLGEECRIELLQDQLAVYAE